MDSLNSEGIIFKKPNSGLRRGENGKKSGTDANFLSVNILRTFEEPSETIPRRVKLYEKSLETLTNCFKGVQEKYNGELKNSLEKFITRSFELIEKNQHSVLPIGILESGLSAAENSTLFDYMQGKLSSREFGQKVYVVRIQSGTSATTKAAFIKICSQILAEKGQATTEDHSETDTDDLNSSKELFPAKKQANLSLYDLKSILPSERSAYKIVVLIEDLEYFPNLVITQLLTLMGCSNLPFVFVFGVTHGQFINNLVPLHCPAEFIIEKFYSVTPKERLNDFMRRVLFDCTNPFKISGSIASYLESHYREDNFSVDSLYQSIKFCLRQYFRTAKSAFCSLEDAETYSKEELKCFSAELFGENSTEGTPRKKQRNTKNSWNSTEALTECIECLQGWQLCLRLFCFINGRIPNRPLGETYPHMYSLCCKDNSSFEDENSPFYNFFRSLENISKQDLEDLLADCIDFLKGGKNLPKIELVTAVASRLDKLADELAEDEKEANKENPVPEKRPEIKLKLKKITNRSQLKYSILENKHKKEGTTIIHAVKKELATYLKSLLRKHMQSNDVRKSLSVFTFDDLSQLVNAMFPSNFLQLNEDICNPGLLLECKCCSGMDAESIDDSLPDVSILYKLISEHTTKKVDLNLVYRAFVGVVEVKISSRKRKSTSSANDAATASYLIRFRRAIGELQHMGFLKRTKTKPDEITRLTWW